MTIPANIGKETDMSDRATEVELYFHDLKEELQLQLLELYSVSSAKDMNWDVYPIHVFTVEKDESENTRE